MKKNGKEYLTMHPKLRKWINECVMCYRKGYKPDIPEDIYPHFTVTTYNLKSFFSPLELDEDGLCKTCSAIMRKCKE